MGWRPSESEEYLSFMGALDVTDPGKPNVVVPNYFDAPSNCGGPSQYYLSCCISECESLLGYLERKLASPKALPQQIIELVENLPSSTIETPRTLPSQLVKRLESVAETHGGHAPLHGRLFRQWMHHAYPAECSFPSLARSNPLHRPLMADEFEAETGLNATVDDEKRAAYIKAAKLGAQAGASTSTDDFTDELPWSHEEELFVVCRTESAASSDTSP